MHPFLESEEFKELFVKIPFNASLGTTLKDVDSDGVVVEFKMRPDLIGNYHYGNLHGGVISAVMDMAAGCAVLAAGIERHADKSMEELRDLLGRSSTVDLHVQYLRPGQGERFFCRAKVKHAGAKISFVQMELADQDGLVLATGIATFRAAG